MRFRAAQEKKLILRVKSHIRKHVVSGLLLLIPLGITLFAIRFLFRVSGGIFIPLVKRLLPDIPAAVLIMISIIIFLILIYVLGFITTLFIGRRLVAWGEAIIMRLPLLNTIYSASKKIVSAFSVANKSNFKSVVFIDFPRTGVKSVGFITGTIEDEQKRKCYIVVIPTAPNPTSGFIQVIPCEEVLQTTLSIEEGIKMVVSGGIWGPENFNTVLEEKQASAVTTLTGETISGEQKASD